MRHTAILPLLAGVLLAVAGPAETDRAAFAGPPDETLSTVTVTATDWQYAWGYPGYDAGYRHASIPDDEEMPVVCTFVLLDGGGTPATGLADTITPQETTGVGVTTFSPVVEVSPGVYQCLATNDTGDNATAKLVSCTVDLTPLGGGISDIADEDDFIVFVPGTGEWPRADAGGNQTISFGDTLTLDASLSQNPDAPHVLDACMWFYGYEGHGLGITTGAGCQLTEIIATLPVGVHEIWLVVCDGRTAWHEQRYDIDIITVTAEAPVTDTVNLDLRSAMDYDWIGTADEIALANAWYDAQSPVPVDRTIRTAFTDPAGIHLLPPDWTPRWFVGTQHHACDTEGTRCPGREEMHPGSVPEVVVTPYANYQIESWQADDLGQATDPFLTPAFNGIRLGTSRGTSNGDIYDIDADGPAGWTVDTDDPPDGVPDVDPDDIDRSVSSTTCTLPVAHQGHYTSVNFLMFGTGDAGGTAVDTDDPPDSVADYNVMTKRAWMRIHAIYNDGEELVWTSPKTQTHPGAPYGDNRDDIPGGVPPYTGRDTTYQADWDADYVDGWTGHRVATREVISAGNPAVSVMADGDCTLWEPTDRIRLDGGRLLTGFRFEVDNGPDLWRTGFPEGDTVVVVAAAAGDHDSWMTVSASLDFDWVYPNAPATTNWKDHRVRLTLELTDDWGDEYTIDIGENDSTLANFQIVDSRQLDWDKPWQPTTVDLAGGMVESSTPGTHTLNVNVSGKYYGELASTNVTLKLRTYGDIDDNGVVDTQDKLELNRHLNGIATPATFRELDLTGDGTTIDTNDKLQINRVLNGIPIP